MSSAMSLWHLTASRSCLIKCLHPPRTPCLVASQLVLGALDSTMWQFLMPQFDWSKPCKRVSTNENVVLVDMFAWLAWLLLEAAVLGNSFDYRERKFSPNFATEISGRNFLGRETSGPHGSWIIRPKKLHVYVPGF